MRGEKRLPKHSLTSANMTIRPGVIQPPCWQLAAIWLTRSACVHPQTSNPKGARMRPASRTRAAIKLASQPRLPRSTSPGTAASGGAAIQCRQLVLGWILQVYFRLPEVGLGHTNVGKREERLQRSERTEWRQWIQRIQWCERCRRVEQPLCWHHRRHFWGFHCCRSGCRSRGMAPAAEEDEIQEACRAGYQ